MHFALLYIITFFNTLQLIEYNIIAIEKEQKLARTLNEKRTIYVHMQ